MRARAWMHLSTHASHSSGFCSRLAGRLWLTGSMTDWRHCAHAPPPFAPGSACVRVHGVWPRACGPELLSCRAMRPPFAAPQMLNGITESSITSKSFYLLTAVTDTGVATPPWPFWRFNHDVSKRGGAHAARYCLLLAAAVVPAAAVAPAGTAARCSPRYAMPCHMGTGARHSVHSLRHGRARAGTLAAVHSHHACSQSRPIDHISTGACMRHTRTCKMPLALLHPHLEGANTACVACLSVVPGRAWGGPVQELYIFPFDGALSGVDTDNDGLFEFLRR